jgi:hypothetical protein
LSRKHRRPQSVFSVPARSCRTRLVPAEKPTIWNVALAMRNRRTASEASEALRMMSQARLFPARAAFNHDDSGVLLNRASGDESWAMIGSRQFPPHQFWGNQGNPFLRSKPVQRVNRPSASAV